MFDSVLIFNARNIENGANTTAPFILSNIAAVLAQHGCTTEAELDYVAKVCLNCGSIAECEDAAQRDLTVRNFDLTCHRNQTYVLVSR